MTVNVEDERRISLPPSPLLLSLSRPRREREKKRAMPQQKTIVIPPEGVNFCAVGQCYRRRAQSATRQNFVRFYMRIGWSSPQDPSLYPPPRCRIATSRASRGVPSPGPAPDADERPNLLPRTHLHLEKPTEFLYH